MAAVAAQEKVVEKRLLQFKKELKHLPVWDVLTQNGKMAIKKEAKLFLLTSPNSFLYGFFGALSLICAGGLWFQPLRSVTHDLGFGIAGLFFFGGGILMIQRSYSAYIHQTFIKKGYALLFLAELLRIHKNHFTSEFRKYLVDSDVFEGLKRSGLLALSLHCKETGSLKPEGYTEELDKEIERALESWRKLSGPGSLSYFKEQFPAEVLRRITGSYKGRVYSE